MLKKYAAASRLGRWAVAVGLLATAPAFAQGPAALPVITLAPDGTPALIRLGGPDAAANAAARSAADGRQVLRQYLALGTNDDMRPLRTETDPLGYVHERYQQYYRGIRVEHGQYSVHRRGGAVETLSGELKRPTATLNVQPTLSAAAARQRALAAVGATRYMWQDPAEEGALRQLTGDATATYFPKGELVLVNDYRQGGPNPPLVLAWKFNVYAAAPLSRAWLYVDAHSGQVVLRDAIIKHADATGTFATKYSGTKTGTTDSFAGGFRLRDGSRGLGVQTFNLQKSTNYANGTEFVDNDNNWTAAEYDNATFDNVALDAHYGAQATYDYWQQVHGRNSFDNAGAAIISYVHYGTNFENAYWNGMVMTYGDGATRFRPLASLDVCGHEIGHAVCERTAGLIYQNEPGALNEGFSDIWGACVEFFKDPTKQTWLIGEDITKTSTALRSMSNPNQFNQPDTYLGTRWVASVATPTSSNDYGGVHTNSGVLNYWFYLLSVGGSGTNDVGTAFSVSGIGISKAAFIAYRAERLYLTSSATYAAARNATLQAAYDLYGAGSAEVAAVANAWRAVNVGEAAPTLAGLSPASGPVGTTITLTGTNLLTTTSVTFNGTPATSYVVNSATQIAVLVPAAATSGAVTVTTPSGSATAGTFTVTSTGAAPAIAAFAPAGGQVVGGTVNIFGTNLGGVTSVTINGVAAPVQPGGSLTSLNITVPAGATTGLVRLTTPGGIATSAAAYPVLPTITGFAPATGSPGTTVTISGNTFGGATGVSFNGTPATFTLLNTGVVTATVPAGATSGSVTVTTAAGTATSVGPFTVTGSAAPVITSISPATGGPNTVVTITGTGLLGATAVLFGGAAAGSFVVNSNSSISAVVPLLAVTAPVAVVTPAGVATGGTFTVGTAASCNLTLNVTPAAPVVCGPTGGSVLLTASALGVAQVPSYTVAPITYAPLPTTGTAGPTGDDAITAALPIGFPFSFFGQNYTSFYLGTNGNIQFSSPTNSTALYGAAVPKAGGTGNFIALAWADWNQAVGGNITYYTTGTAPNRQLVVSYNGVPHYDGGATFTGQLVLSEGSNFIDFIYTNVGLAQPLALAGVENAAGTVGVALPGRNSTNWRAANEAWRFTPASAPGALTYAWSPATGLSSTTAAAVTAAPASPTTYTVTVTDGACSRTATVTVATSLSAPAVHDTARCGSGPVTLLASGAPADGRYQWYADSIGNTAIVGATGAAFTTPSLSATTTYYVSALSGTGCESPRAPLNVTVNPVPAPPTVAAGSTALLLTQSTTLTVTSAEAGVTYSWSGPGLNATTGASVTATPPATGTATYTCTAVGAGGCAAPATGTVSLTVTMPPAPTVASFTPLMGTAGQPVTLTGTGFTTASAVRFNGTDAAFVINSNTSITATAPAGATTGKLTVTNPAGTATSAGTYTVLLPKVTSFTPTSGLLGASVTITGSYFTDVVSVKFNGVSAPFTVNSATSISTSVPVGATTGKVSVTTLTGTGTSLGNFTVSIPTISTISPSLAATGTTVTITGNNFSGATSVTFNGVPAASFTVVSNTSITALIPATATTGKVSVTTPTGTGLSLSAYKILPTLSSFSPNKGVPGDSVTITGSGFTDAISVKFYTGTTPALRIISSTTIRVAVPGTATTGKLSVATPGGTVASVASFTVGPIITDFTPAQGAPGSIVLVSGLNFISGTTVRINGVTAVTTYNSATQLTAVVPAAATSGPVSVTNPVGTTTGAAYTVVSGPAPAVTSFSPTTGIVGTVVTITGTNLMGATEVRFGGAATTAVTVLSGTQVQAAVPAGAVTGKVYVTTAAGMAQSAANFTMIVPPTISMLAPTAGSPGSVVLITGNNFTGLTGVAFNGTAATSFSTTNSMNLYAVVPAGATTGPITVTNLAGATTSATSFTVTTTPAPSITGFSPTSGPVGASVTISGTNFTGVTQVRFNNTLATSFIVNSGTTITATVPTGATTGKVFVTAAGGMAQSTGNFTVLLPPTISSFSPVSGPVGTVVTISGSNLTGATAVTFGGVAATTITPVSSIQVKATVPAGAITGVIRVTTAAGTATSVGSFSVTATRLAAATAPTEPLTLALYPNPAREQVWVQLSGLTAGETAPTVEIFDATNRRVQAVTLPDGTGALSLRDLPAGIYLVRAGAVAQRLIVE